MLSNRLQPGDEIRIIAPSRSMALLKDDQVKISVNRLEALGFKVSFGKHVYTHDEFFSSSIEERVEDLHDAFRDTNVKGILTVIGGFNSNQLLKYIDFDLIKNNPKVFCGYSDITALSLSIYQKTGLITYSGPHFSSFGMKHGFEYTLDYFLTALTNDAPFEVIPSETWSDDAWYLDQEDRKFHEQKEYLVLQEGEAEGTLMGGNLCTMNLLQGTEFMPSLKNSILLIEDDYESHPSTFDRDLQSILHLPDANEIKGVLIGRFQKESHMTDEALRKIISSKNELKGLPIIANVNFGHTQPMVTIPVGGKAKIHASSSKIEIIIDQK
ncbi:S66 peptidase family protein [Bacillus sp. CGMCC 1.16607]|uniref:S66 family peptidase n=1 Tax=Bacillus sp. CGMCC 1.16607 TaxID=3351842 RepID=UPI00363413B3